MTPEQNPPHPDATAEQTAPTTTSEALLTPHTAARILGVDTAELARMRRAGTGPQWATLDETVIRYHSHNLARWQSEHHPDDTSHPQAPPKEMDC